MWEGVLILHLFINSFYLFFWDRVLLFSLSVLEIMILLPLPPVCQDCRWHFKCILPTFAPSLPCCQVGFGMEWHQTWPWKPNVIDQWLLTLGLWITWWGRISPSWNACPGLFPSHYINFLRVWVITFFFLKFFLIFYYSCLGISYIHKDRRYFRFYRSNWITQVRLSLSEYILVGESHA
jgi:hypothetical protein